MSICIACNEKSKDCECFGQKPKSKLDRYIQYDMRGKVREKKALVHTHGRGGYSRGCRCEECLQGYYRYYMENKAKINEARKSYYLKTGK